MPEVVRKEWDRHTAGSRGFSVGGRRWDQPEASCPPAAELPPAALTQYEKPSSLHPHSAFHVWSGWRESKPHCQLGN
jgi:hypothetical protein